VSGQTNSQSESSSFDYASAISEYISVFTEVTQLIITTTASDGNTGVTTEEVPHHHGNGVREQPCECERTIQCHGIDPLEYGYVNFLVQRSNGEFEFEWRSEDGRVDRHLHCLGSLGDLSGVCGFQPAVAICPSAAWSY
jgi:hypothetical protein